MKKNYNINNKSRDVFAMGKHHPHEYKEYIAKLVLEEGKKITQLAYEIGIPHGTVSRWVSAYKEKLERINGGSEFNTPSEYKRIEQEFQKRIKELEEENEILKKAMHIFTKNPD
jgi:transposase